MVYLAQLAVGYAIICNRCGYRFQHVAQVLHCLGNVCGYVAFSNASLDHTEVAKQTRHGKQNSMVFGHQLQSDRLFKGQVVAIGVVRVYLVAKRLLIELHAGRQCDRARRVFVHGVIRCIANRKLFGGLLFHVFPLIDAVRRLQMGNHWRMDEKLLIRIESLERCLGDLQQQVDNAQGMVLAVFDVCKSLRRGFDEPTVERMNTAMETTQVELLNSGYPDEVMEAHEGAMRALR